MRPPSSPHELDKVKREKTESDISHPQLATHDATTNNRASHQLAATQGTALSQEQVSTQDHSANGETQGTQETQAVQAAQVGNYEISFPLMLKQTLAIKEGYPTALEFHPQVPTLILGMCDVANG